MKRPKSICRKLTVILPVKNRPMHTLRWLEYAEAVNFPFKILIADGSGSTKLESLLKDRITKTSLDFVYYRYERDATLLKFYKKMVSAISRCRSPFTVIIDNDILPAPDGIFKSLTFLLKNKDYSSCRGQHVDCRLNDTQDTRIPLHGETLEVQNVYFNKKHSIWRSFENEDPLLRIANWSDSTCVLFYNVHKTENFLKAFRFLMAKNVSDIFMLDIILSLIALASGKSKVIDVPYMLRQQNSPAGASRSARRRADIFTRMFEKNWTANVNSLAALVAKCSKPKTGMALRAITKSVMDSVINHYAARVYAHLEKQYSPNALACAFQVTQDDFVYRPADAIKGFRTSWRQQIDFLLK